jgi:DHA1 family tetracycline resistance protein-like MFS transporter
MLESPRVLAAPGGLNRTAFLFLQLTAFLSSVGTGLVIPVLPFLVQRHVGDSAQAAVMVGWLAATYSLCAFFAAPALGALSDAVGRRPVLLVSLLGSAAGYLLFGLSGSLMLAFLARVVDGLTAGNMGALYACMGDTVRDEDRSRYFGRIGATFGVGLIAGPALGGLLVKLGGLRAPFFCAAALTLLSTVAGYWMLPESLAPEHRARGPSWSKLNPFTSLAQLMGLRHLRSLLSAGLLFTASCLVVQVLFVLLAKDRLGWGADTVSLGLLGVGATDILVQGVLLGRLSQAFGERRLLVLGLGLTMSALGVMALVAHWPSGPLMILAVLAVAGGEGLFTASFSALLSRVAGADAQGRVQGGNQALQELATVIVPVVATQLYAREGPGSPFWVAAGAAVLAGFLLSRANRVPTLDGRAAVSE